MTVEFRFLREPLPISRMTAEMKISIVGLMSIRSLNMRVSAANKV